MAADALSQDDVDTIERNFRATLADIVDVEIEGRGDLAVLVCHFVRVAENPDGGEGRHNARQVLKFRKQPDGQWLIAAAKKAGSHSQRLAARCCQPTAPQDRNRRSGLTTHRHARARLGSL